LVTFLKSLSASVFFCLVGQAQQTYFSVPAPDAPELAPRGAYHVGVRTIQLTNPNQVDILQFDKATGKAPLTDRKLEIEVWYPAVIPAGQQEQTVYSTTVPGSNHAADLPGKALRDAPPLSGEKFPLVIVSHGYPGSRTFLSYLTENLASKGYVVAAIDHTDSVAGAVKGFESTLLNRSKDQLFTIHSIGELTAKPDSFLYGLTDMNNVAVVGYSMGGYGALTTAGAGLSKKSGLLSFVPGGYLADLMADSPQFQSTDRAMIKAMVAIAPWGEQPPQSAWDREGLANIHIPSLFISGDHDDVADFENGVKPAFEQAVNSERYLLVYENARHNTGGNPPTPGAILDYRGIESLEEPVWRKERIVEINQHFITAFLDLYVKGIESRRSYLRVPFVKSNDGKWDLPPGPHDDSALSTGTDAKGNPFWKGFQRRWALGLEMYYLPASTPLHGK
jgi:predicted dienelactone hydrolase